MNHQIFLPPMLSMIDAFVKSVDDPNVKQIMSNCPKTQCISDFLTLRIGSQRQSGHTLAAAYCWKKHNALVCFPNNPMMRYFHTGFVKSGINNNFSANINSNRTLVIPSKNDMWNYLSMMRIKINQTEVTVQPDFIVVDPVSSFINFNFIDNFTYEMMDLMPSIKGRILLG